MILGIELLGQTNESERQVLFARLAHVDVMKLVPGDGVVLGDVPEGHPPRIAYLNRRIFLPNGSKHEVRLIFEVGLPVQRSAKLDRAKMFKELQEFVVRKSAVFARPEMAARELTNFFVTFTGE